MVNGSELSDCSKNLICKELEAAVRAAKDDATVRGTVSDQSTQSICHVLEAIFIHGLNDAFFLKGSRYAKYPEPNFWPFVSKFTHKTVRTQIAGFQQIRNEVGRARAWIRIVLNENVLESYVTALDADKNQLKVFYQKSAFLRDRERVDALVCALRQLTQLQLAVPTNSTVLNAWTPTPLIMAGLVAPNAGGSAAFRRAGRPPPLLRRATGSSASLLSDEGGDVPPSASDCQTIGGGGKFCKIGSRSSLFTMGSPQSRTITADEDEEEDDRSSVYSHPSLLDGGISCATRPTANVGLTLSCTPENSTMAPPDREFCVGRGVADDPASDVVVVRRRRTRVRKVSRQLSGGDLTRPRSGNTGGGEMSRSGSQLALEGVIATLAENDSLTVPLAIPVTPSANEPFDSGYEHATDNDESKASPPLSAGRVKHSSGEDSGRTSGHQSDLPIRPGSSLHDELRAIGATDGTQSSVSSGDFNRRHFTTSAAIDCGPADTSCSSSFDTGDFLLPVGSFSTALCTAAGKADLFDASVEESNISVTSSTTSSGGLDDPSAATATVLSPVKSRKLSASPSVGSKRWSSPAERLLRQLERRSDASFDALPSSSRRSLSPISPLTSPLTIRSMSTAPVNLVATTIAELPAVLNEPILTRNVFTGEEILVHVLSRSEDLPYQALILDREPIEDDDVVVVDLKALMEADEYGISQDLLRITRIPLERGLDAQDFRCPSCRKSIGGAFGTFKMCHLDCKYYCEDCWRRGDDSLIPARMVWNWDCRRRPICKASRAFLRSIADRPFIRIDRLNPALYEHSRPMEKIRGLRVKLSLAVMYLLSCKRSVAEDIRQRIFPHDYYHNDIHLYSITDLEGVLTGATEKRLNTLITFCVNHVNACPLCFQKGFVCELCQSRRVIYPFQTDIAHRCTTCFSVFHTVCIRERACPKCERRTAFCAPDFQPLSPPAPPTPAI